MFVQDLINKPIRDFVFPVGLISEKEYLDNKTGIKHDLRIFSLKGTAFFIGADGIAITASHVVNDLNDGGSPVGLFVSNGSWCAVKILRYEKHPKEDVAIIVLDLDKTYSFFQISSSSEGASCDYSLWGYPDAVARELQQTMPSLPGRGKIENPDLIYNKGYIRRRISRELPSSVFKGEAFYELSEVAGSCCSGSPIIKTISFGQNNQWQVIGVYIGEQTSTSHSAVGYAVRSDSFASWVPSSFGVELCKVAANIV